MIRYFGARINPSWNRESKEKVLFESSNFTMSGKMGISINEYTVVIMSCECSYHNLHQI